MGKRMVIHPELGVGEIIQTRYSGFELQIIFTDGNIRWIRFDELKEYESNSGSDIPTVVPKRNVLSEQTFLSRRMIEAFRLGIVPTDLVDQFTFGRDAEVTKINEWLQSSNKNVSYVFGEYGTGKSHLLSSTIKKASHSGYAVALVETDRTAVAFNKPKALYSNIIKAFQYIDPIDGRKKDFRDFLRSAIQSHTFKDHIYFKWFQKYDHDVLWEWILCDSNCSRPTQYALLEEGLNLYASQFELLPAYQTAANVYCYLLSSIGWAAKNILGLSGLLVIFDEAESIEQINGAYSTDKANNFIAALIRTANNDKILNETSSLWETGLTFSSRSKLPFLYANRSEIKLMFAFTPSNYSPPNSPKNPPCQIILKDFTDSALKQIFDEVFNLYKKGYAGFSIDENTFEKIFKSVNDPTNNVRRFVKASVEALDIIRLTDNIQFLK